MIKTILFILALGIIVHTLPPEDLVPVAPVNHK